MNLPPLPKDRIGRDINIGDYIVYAGQAGDSACLNFGKVVDMPIREKYNYHTKQEEPYYKLKVQPCEQGGEPIMTRKWDGTQMVDTGKSVRCVTLEFSNRTAVIDHQ